MEESDSELDRRFSDLVAPNFSKGSPKLLESGNKNHESDSDDPFDDILASKNINFSSSRSYQNDINIFTSTPLRNQNSSTDSNESHSKKLFNSEKKNIATVGQDLGKPRSKSASKSSSTLKKRAALVSPARLVNNSRGNLFDVPTDYTQVNNQRAKSHNSKISSEKNVQKATSFRDSPVMKKSTMTNGSKTLGLLSKSPAALSKYSKPIPSFKKYSLMRTALAAKKEFEDLVKRVALKKALKGKQENIPPSGNHHSILASSTSVKQTTFGTPVHSSTRIDSLSPKRRSSCGSNSTAFVSCLDKSDLHETKNCQSSLKTPKSKTFLKDITVNSLNDVEKVCGSSDKNAFSTNQLADPYVQNILQGVVAYVEIRSGKEYRNLGTQAELESLGAKVEKNFTKKVTHCFFHGGKMSTYRNAVDMNVPLVSTLWIEACKEQLCQVPLKGYEPHGIERYQEELPLYRLKTKIRRPMTDSKIPSKTRKRLAERDKGEKPADKSSGQSDQADKLIDALHSVAGDFRKASHQFDKILKSPILQNKLEMAEPASNKKDSKNKSTGKGIKKLVFTSSSDEEVKKLQEKPKEKPVEQESTMDDSSFELRISYDSDDLLSYAKKQAASNRLSAPGRLLTSRKCKRLLTSCEKPPNPANTKVDNPSTVKQVTPRSKKSCRDKAITGEDLEKESNKQKAKKRRLLLNSQGISDFTQDSRENSPELSYRCPYIVSPDKKAGKKKLAPVPVFSDWESDDSVTRARRESSALFVKKEKKVTAQRSVPTIVCTSLPRSEVETVVSIAAQLGEFVVEATVSERTTHLVTPSPRRTVNLLKGIARGCWVLNIKWVYDSLEAEKWLHEEKYEMLDFSPSVRQARLERQAFGREFSLELFTEVGPVYVCRATLPPQCDLIELLRLCGATVVSSARAARLVVGSPQNLSPTLGTRPPLVVREKWVLDSITRLTSLDPAEYQSLQSEM